MNRPRAEVRRSPDAGEDRERTQAVLLAALVLVLPLAIGSVLWSAPGSEHRSDPNRWVAVSPVDVLSIVVLLVWLREHGRSAVARLRTSPGLLGGCALGASVLLVAALAAHPSPRGLELVVRIAAAAAVADTVRRMSDARNRRLLLAAVVVSGCAQAVLAMAQSLHGQVFGLPLLELSGPLYPFGDSRAGRGGFGHPYHLACWLVVAWSAAAIGVRRAARPWVWACGLVVCSCGLAVTYSRAALLGLLAAGGVAAVTTVARRDRRAAIVVVALVLGFGTGVAAFGNGWVAKADASRDPASADTGRRDRAAEAVRLIRTEPVIGVGPGRYVLALDGVEHTEPLPAHNLALHVAAEEGIAAGALVTAALVLLGLRCLRRGCDALLVFLPTLPFLLLDAFPYSFPLGIAGTGVWLGLLGGVWTGGSTARERATGTRTADEVGHRDESVLAVPA